MAIDRSHPSTVSLRNTLRKTFRERRRSLSRSEQVSAGAAIVEQSQKHALFSKAKKVAVYMTNDGEVDTKALILYLWEHDIQVFLPVLHPFCEGYLVFLAYTPLTPMRANHFGILEPKLDCSSLCPLEQLDILIAPVVAFDERGNRLGMGGGFYDRTLAHMVTQPKPTTTVIGLAHDIQKTLSMPTEIWDIPIPFILTPSQLYSCAL